MTPHLLSSLIPIWALSLTVLALMGSVWILSRMIGMLQRKLLSVEERVKLLEHVTHDHHPHIR